ncbi:hypothetical protein CVT25_002230 [Psilocybe cyanescens]|uniref:HhH-GPD domain-containing protein n=1 Tax=Psilocybe cyanescens TaxID=93625 RepID=A0A409XF63_PSICY|nr:hypothetical protein CVT25_002230 [Psilocybe cyanescens]
MNRIYQPTTPKKTRSSSGRLSSDSSRERIIQSPYFSPTKGRTPAKYDASDVEEATFYRLRSFDKSNEYKNPVKASYECGRATGRDFGDYRSEMSRLTSHLGTLKPILIQEQVADDPWKLLVAVTLLNKTAGKLAIPVFHDIIKRWPTPFDLSQADDKELAALIHRLGTYNIRSKRLIAISKAYVQEPPSLYDIRSSNKTSTHRRCSRFFTPPSNGHCKYPGTPVSHYPGTGPYALDSYRIFSSVRDEPDSEEWMTVMPSDKELILFLKWKWAFIKGMEWSSMKGAVGAITEKYLSSLIAELEKNNVTTS